MFYAVTVNYFDEDDYKVKTNHLLICGENYSAVTDSITSYYGEDTVDSIEMKPFSPDDRLVFDGEDSDLYQEVISTLGLKAIW